VLLPLAVAVLLAFALAPLVGWLRRIGTGRALSVMIAASLSVAVMIAVGFFIASKTVELADELPRYQSTLIEKVQSLRGTTLETGAVERVFSLLKNLREQVSGTGRAPAPPPRTAEPAPSDQKPVQVEIKEPELAPIQIAATVIPPIIEFIVIVGIIVIFMIFILLHKEDIRDRFIRLAGPLDIQRTTLFLDDAAELLGRYLLSQTAINALFGACITLGLWIIGIPSPLLWGLNVAILRFIPYFGVPLAAVVPVLLALSVDPGWTMALATIAFFVVIELIVGQAIEPWWFGRRMGLSSLAVVIAAAFWTLIWGPFGLLLSTPLTVCLVVLGRHVEHLRFLDVLLGDQPPLAAEEALYTRMLGDDADQAATEAEGFLKEYSLCRYYDEVVLKALAIGQADFNRGVLDDDRAEKIRNTTRLLIDNLSDVENGDAATAHTRPGCAVLCIGGRGPLDDGAAALLVHLLQKEGVDAKLMIEHEASAAARDATSIASFKVMCLCYLDAGNLSRARYVLRRLKHRFADAVAFAAVWGSRTDSALDAASASAGYTLITSLQGAVESILTSLDRNSTESAARAAESKPPARAPAVA